MKALASFGPGGALGVFAEKLIHILFPEAYEMQDPNFEKARKDEDELMKLREEFVKEIFEQKGKWEREINSSGEEKEEAYKSMKDLIQEFRIKIVKTNLRKLTRERLALAQGSIQYQRRVDAA